MTIPFVDLTHQNQALKSEILHAIEQVIDSSWYILGEQVKKFEKDCSHYFGSKHCIGVANGLDAIILALKAAGVGHGDEVIVPAHTYIATWLAVTHVGATIVPVDACADTYNIDVSKIEEKITLTTKAILPVHLYGNPCQMDTIMQLSEKYNLIVIEDNAQAQGASIDGYKTGSIGHFGATSLYPGKNLGAMGDAGVLLTDSDVYASQLLALRNYGSTIKYENEIIGYNSRLDEMQAAILSVKLRKLDEWNQERNTIAHRYTSELKDIPTLHLPTVLDSHHCVYHQYVILTAQRDRLQAYLKQRGVETLIHYPIPPYRQNAYISTQGIHPDHFPIADAIANKCLSLPIYPGLSREKIDYICHIIQEYFHNT